MQSTVAMVGTATIGSPVISFLTVSLGWGIVIYYSYKFCSAKKALSGGLERSAVTPPANLDVVPEAPIQQVVDAESSINQVVDLLSTPEGMLAVAQATDNLEYVLINTSGVAPVVAAFSSLFIYRDFPGLLPANYGLLEFSMFYSLAGLGFTCLTCQWPMYLAINNFGSCRNRIGNYRICIRCNSGNLA